MPEQVHSLPEWDDETKAAIIAAWRSVEATGYGVITLDIKGGQVTDWDVKITGKCRREVKL
jgi:hypothetical protein